MFTAAILKNYKKIEIHEFEFPKKLRDDQVLIKIKYSGICGSQIMEYLGNRGKDKYLPHSFGHEAVGKIVRVGKRVKKVKIKDKVILSWIKGKGLDFGGFKLKDKRNKLINFGPISTLSSYAIVSENRVFLKPNKMSDIEAVLYGCAIPTGAGMVLNELKRIKKKHKVCLIGIGGVGLSALLVLTKKKNNIHVIETNPNKLKFFKKFKFKIITEQEQKNFKDYFDYCIETSGNANMIENGFSLIKKNGTLIFASHPKKSDKIKIKPHDLISGKKIFGSWGGGCKLDKDIDKIFNFFNRESVFSNNGKISFYKLTNINSAFKEVISGKINRAIIKF